MIARVVFLFRRAFSPSRYRMGIHGLSKVLGDHAPQASKENEMKNYFGRKIAIDASMSIYQFLIAVRSDGGVLANEAGETTRCVSKDVRFLLIISVPLMPPKIAISWECCTEPFA